MHRLSIQIIPSWLLTMDHPRCQDSLVLAGDLGALGGYSTSCCRQSLLGRGCFACMLRGVERSTLFLVATEWQGTAQMSDGAQTGQILTLMASGRGVGWP